MTVPSRPLFLEEGPETACIIDRQLLGWKNCGSLGAAMGIDKSTLGRVRLSGCQVRRETGDTVGGTTIEQNSKVAEAHGVHVEVHTGSNVSTPRYTAVQLQSGRGFSLAGNCSALGKKNVNHNVWVNEAAGGTLGSPSRALVYDPWSDGPEWWAWSKVLAFAAALHPWGENDPRKLGPGKFYCGIYPDTEPHVHLKFGGVRTKPFPDHQVIKSPGPGRVNVRSGPSKAYGVITTLPTGQPWAAWQYKALGGLDLGTRGWYGDHNGTAWVHESGLAGEGGTT
jgi:hypothetical protein